MAQKFHERFNIDIGLDEARRRFVNRANNVILYDLRGGCLHLRGSGPAERLERFVCSKLGEPWNGFGCLSGVLGNDFNMHVRALEALYEHPETRSSTDLAVKGILADSELDLGIRWDNGHFLPSGAPVLDEKLVNDVLGCLAPKEYEGGTEALSKGPGTPSPVNWQASIPV